ncbi:DISARM system phospholipase D-like protein DrmC [Nannocystis pusilla]|uniref:DISARM system phospholipase D-like protein DrmC n=1 Tax=Nannocystis pusilla TaxID=889268 RepID=A0ABS7TME7_9BACT|nr:DISARM system phospholipase D-like protein DrmC [Nannocystis pusilla]
MSGGLAGVSTTSLERLRAGLASGRLKAPLSQARLIAFGFRAQLDVLATALAGHSREACLAVIEAVLAERAKYERPAPELVWTGPEDTRATARDTAVILRELFENAQERVILAGYSFKNATEVLGPLHASMRERGVEALFFIDVAQLEHSVAAPEAALQNQLQSFVDTNWRFGPPFPAIYCDRRALRPGPPWSSLHAKCVAVDGKRAFVSSANFTSRGQDRNIEAGVLLHDATFAAQLERQWLGLIKAGLVLRWDGDGQRASRHSTSQS